MANMIVSRYGYLDLIWKEPLETKSLIRKPDERWLKYSTKLTWDDFLDELNKQMDYSFNYVIYAANKICNHWYVLENDSILKLKTSRELLDAFGITSDCSISIYSFRGMFEIIVKYPDGNMGKYSCAPAVDRVLKKFKTKRKRDEMAELTKEVLERVKLDVINHNDNRLIKFFSHCDENVLRKYIHYGYGF